MKKIINRLSLFWLLQIGGWSGYALLSLATILPFSNYPVDVYYVVTFVCGFASSLLLHGVCRRQWRSGLRFPGSFVVLLSFCVGLAYLITTAGMIAMQSPHSWHRLLSLITNFPGLGYHLVILVSWCSLYFGIKY